MSRKDAVPQPCIYVIAGPNGSGKSSIMGAMFLEAGADYLNPDAESKKIRDKDPRIPVAEANSMAWNLGKSMLERAIREQKTFALETTLGGNTIPALLEAAAASGLQLRIAFLSLATPELHIQRVRARVAAGGHHIPQAKIRERFDRGRANLIRLLPKINELRLYDNTREADPAQGLAPEPLPVLHTRAGRILAMCDPAEVPAWAKPVVEVAIKLGERLQP